MKYEYGKYKAYLIIRCVLICEQHPMNSVGMSSVCNMSMNTTFQGCSVNYYMVWPV